MMSVIYFLLLVGVLVAIHEFGHFVAAKALDFKVLRFSIGFGRPLIRVAVRETEYQIALIPLGGYVRILGEDVNDDVPLEDISRSFNAKPLWQRLVVVFAGPAANLLLPVLIYFVLFAGHTQLPASTVGDTLEGSPAELAGIEPGDRIVSVNGDAVRYWESFENIIQNSPGAELRLKVRRNDREFEKYITPVEDTVRFRDGRSRTQGRIGITQAPFLPLVGVIDRNSPARAAGLKTGDLIISIDGDPVHNWTEVRPKLERQARRTNVVYLRGTPLPGIPQVKLLAADFADLVPETRVSDTGQRSIYTGIEPAEMFIAHVDPASPADRAGLRPGDLITELDGVPIKHWILLDQQLQSRPDHEWAITWRRASENGEVVTMSAKFTQVRRRQKDEYENVVERLVFGARSDYERGRGELVPIEGRFSYAIGKAVDRTGETISAMIGGFWSILAGDAPRDSVGGPLMMYHVASVSGNKGWDSFLLMLALISVNLGLINLLPIPVLDGGHLMIFAAEAVRRKPLSIETRRWVQFAGLVIVGVITILALRNDVMRYLVQ
jgi:regulator of sigma E protease